MTKVVRFHETGGPEVLRVENENVSSPQGHEVQIRQHAVGVNYIDTYFRSGLYQSPLPSPVGFEGAGVVIAIGAEVKDIKTGDRVAYGHSPLGAYAEVRNIPEHCLVKIPDGISFELAASLMLKGLTVWYLFHQTYALKKNETFLFHAAAGGVGLLACQWARHIGAKMIGTVSSAEKGKKALEMGAFAVINYRDENIVKRVLEINGGEKVSVVYDSVGKDTWMTSLDCLRMRGHMVSFGNASGPVTGVNLSDLATRGSLTVTRPMLFSYVETAGKLRAATDVVFDLALKGILKVDVSHTYPLEKAVDAHTALLNRDRVGSLLLIP